MTKILPRGVLLLSLSASLFGCAEIRMGEPKTVETKVLRREQRVAPSARGFTAGFEQNQNEIYVSAYSSCDLVESRRVRNTVRREKENTMLAPELVLLGFGLIPAGIGAGILADSSKVYADDRNARLYNQSGPTGAIAGGIALVVWGVAMMAVPLVDITRSVGSEETETEAEEAGEVIQSSVPCPSAPSPKAGLAVIGKTQFDSFGLGATNAQGVLRVDLARVVPARIFEVEPQLKTIDVFANEKRLGVANVSDLPRYLPQLVPNDLDEQLWGISNSNSCELKEDCGGVLNYLNRLPNGRHAGQARALLEAQKKGPPLQVASPVEMTSEEKAKCNKECQKACKGDKACVLKCSLEKCQ